MQVYFVRDKDPDGGRYSVQRLVPTPETERITVQEVRKGNFPDSIFLKMLLLELERDPVTFWDSHISPYFDKASVWWTREGGYVNDSNTV